MFVLSLVEDDKNKDIYSISNRNRWAGYDDSGDVNGGNI